MDLLTDVLDLRKKSESLQGIGSLINRQSLGEAKSLSFIIAVAAVDVVVAAVDSVVAAVDAVVAVVDVGVANVCRVTAWVDEIFAGVVSFAVSTVD